MNALEHSAITFFIDNDGVAFVYIIIMLYY